MKYVIDTNILINFEKFAPPAFHLTFWKRLLENVKNGNIIILEEIDKEWRTEKDLKKQFSKQVTKVDDVVRERAAEINSKYEIITKDARGILKSEADPILIAYAEIHKYTVFTYEAKRKISDDPMKIPDVCEQLNIPYQRLPSRVFEEIGFPKI